MARARGSRRFTLDARTFLRGVSTSDETQDGGFSPSSKGVQIFVTAGLVHSGATFANEWSAAIQSNGYFAFTNWHTTASPGLGRALSSNASFDGYFCQLNDTSGQPTVSATDTGRDYKPGISDMLKYQSSIFTTSTTNVALSTFDFGTNDFTWWTVTRGHAALSSNVLWHGIVEYGGIMYIADGRYLHSWDGTTSTTQVLDLPDGMTITSMVVHNNLLTISAEFYFDNLVGNYYRGSKIFTWDGFSPSWLSESDVNERIDTLLSDGGVLFATTPRFFGYFNGVSLVPLRKLTTQVRKYQITSARDRIYIAQGSDVLCYGNPILGRPRVFSYPLKFTATISSIYAYRDGYLTGSSSTSAIHCTNIDGTGGSSSILYSDKVPLGGYGTIRHIELETEVMASGDSFAVAYVDSRGTTKTVNTFSFASHGAKSFIGFDVLNGVSTYICQLKITIAGRSRIPPSTCLL